jgi:polar amino acid transport system substrate-binding protein
MRIPRSLAVIGIAVACLSIALQAKATEPGCPAGSLGKKYPSLVGKTIRIAQDGETPPFSFRDPANFENLIGFDADFARAAFACIGAQIEFKTGAWSGMLPSVIAGQADLMWDSLYYTPARAQQVDFVSYLLAATGAMVRKGNPKGIHALDDVCGVSAEAGLGTVEEASFRKVSEKCVASGKPPVEILTYQDMPSGSRMLQTGRAEVMLTDSGAVGQMVATNPNGFERAFTIKTDFKVAVGISKKQPELRDAVFEAIKLMQADGTQEALLKKYHIDLELLIPTEVLTK